MKTTTTMTTMEHRNLAMNAPITRTYIESLRRAETDPDMIKAYDLAIARFGIKRR